MANIVEKLEALDGLLDRLIEGQGITPEGVIEITENGEVDVSQYAIANVSVTGSGGGVSGIEIGEFTLDSDTPTNDSKLLFSFPVEQGLPKRVTVLRENPTRNLISASEIVEIVDLPKKAAKYSVLYRGASSTVQFCANSNAAPNATTNDGLRIILSSASDYYRVYYNTYNYILPAGRYVYLLWY